MNIVHVRIFGHLPRINGKMATYSIVEIIIQPKKMKLVARIVFIYILEQLYFIKALIEKILVILYDFHTYIHASVQVMCLNSFAECS